MTTPSDDFDDLRDWFPVAAKRYTDGIGDDTAGPEFLEFRARCWVMAGQEVPKAALVELVERANKVVRMSNGDDHPEGFETRTNTPEFGPAKNDALDYLEMQLREAVEQTIGEIRSSR